MIRFWPYGLVLDHFQFLNVKLPVDVPAEGEEAASLAWIFTTALLILYGQRPAVPRNQTGLKSINIAAALTVFDYVTTHFRRSPVNISTIQEWLDMLGIAAAFPYNLLEDQLAIGPNAFIHPGDVDHHVCTRLLEAPTLTICRETILPSMQQPGHILQLHLWLVQLIFT